MSGQKAIPLVVGGVPRVDLLPPEVKASRRAHATRRMLVYGIVGVAVVMALAIAGSVVLAGQAQSDLATAQAETQTLLSQQQKYIEVKRVQDQVKLVAAGQEVGASTEIQWKDYLDKVQATLPANVAIQGVTVESSTPLAVFAQATVPLQGPRVATVTFDVSSPTLPQLPQWLDSLSTLPGFADATPDSVTFDKSTNLYTAKITMHVGSKAFDGRYASKGK